eukprot:2437-Heterococcus_DN1.PRE.1
MDDVPALRLQYGADLVQLVTLDGDISPATMTTTTATIQVESVAALKSLYCYELRHKSNNTSISTTLHIRGR